MNGHGAEMKIQREREREGELITIPRVPGVYFSICKRWLHYPEFNRSRLSGGCIKVTLIRRANRKKDRRGNRHYVMYPLCCSCPSILAITYQSPVLLTPPHPSSPLLSPRSGPQGATLFRRSLTSFNGD